MESEESSGQTGVEPPGPDAGGPDTEPGGTQPESTDRTEQESTEGTEEASAGQAEGEREPLPKDVQYDILKNKRRRLVMRYLSEEDGPASLGTLSEYVAGVENDKDPHKLDSQERKRAYVGLYQCHLPRMADAGVIEFNKDRGLVEQGPHADELLPHVERDDDGDERLVQLYLVSSLLGLGLYLLTQSPLLGVGWLGPPVLAATLVAVAAISVDQLRRQPDEE